LDIRKWHVVVGEFNVVYHVCSWKQLPSCLRDCAIACAIDLVVCCRPLLDAASVVMASLVNSLVRRWRESCDERLKQLRQIQQRMQTASSYSEWREFAQQLDKMGYVRGGDSSGKIRESLYDRQLLLQKVQHLQSFREQGNVKEMMFALRTDLIRNIANVAKRYG
jgi:hypothetical protein